MLLSKSAFSAAVCSAFSPLPHLQFSPQLHENASVNRSGKVGHSDWGCNQANAPAILMSIKNATIPAALLASGASHCQRFLHDNLVKLFLELRFEIALYSLLPCQSDTIKKKH